MTSRENQLISQPFLHLWIVMKPNLKFSFVKSQKQRKNTFYVQFSYKKNNRFANCHLLLLKCVLKWKNLRLYADFFLPFVLCSCTFTLKSLILEPQRQKFSFVDFDCSCSRYWVGGKCANKGVPLGNVWLVIGALYSCEPGRSLTQGFNPFGRIGWGAFWEQDNPTSPATRFQNTSPFCPL